MAVKVVVENVIEDEAVVDAIGVAEMVVVEVGEDIAMVAADTVVIDINGMKVEEDRGHMVVATETVVTVRAGIEMTHHQATLGTVAQDQAWEI